MKKIFLFLLIALTAWSCDWENNKLPEDNLFENKLSESEWYKVSLPIDKNFKKVIALKNEIIFLTDDKLRYYVCSPNFDNWEEKILPAEISIPTPVLFKGSIYLNTDRGIFRYQTNWQKITNWPAWELSANKKNILAIKDNGQWGNDTIMSFNGSDFKPHPKIMSIRDSVNQAHGTTYTLGYNLQAIGDTLRFCYVHIARSGQGFALYSSYDNGQTWKTSWSLFGSSSNLLEQFSCRESLGSVFSSKSGYGMPLFSIKTPWYYTDSYGKFYCLFSDGENFWFSAKKNRITGYNKLVKSYYGIFSSNGDSLISEKAINDIKEINHRLVAVGDSGTIYVLNKP